MNGYLGLKNGTILFGAATGISNLVILKSYKCVQVSVKVLEWPDSAFGNIHILRNHM